MFAEDVHGGLLHSEDIHTPGTVPDIGSEDGWADAFRTGLPAGKDAVFVGLPLGTMAGVKVVRYLLCGEDTNAWRECVIEGELEIRDGYGGYQGEGDDLAKGMHAGVRAAGALR